MRRRREAPIDSKGQSTVEMAFLLPVLLLIVIAVLDLGRAVYEQSVMTNAVREGARAAVVHSNTNTTVVQAVQSAAVGVSIPINNIVILGTREPGTVVTVSAWRTFTPATPLLRNVVAQSIRLSAQSNMVVD